MDAQKNIILSFDLDFTLIDNREGIIKSFNYALEKYHLPQFANKEIEKMIGTPLDIMFSKVTDLDPIPLCSAFREYYVHKGIYQVKLLPGVKELLSELNKWFALGVVTSKKEEIAKNLLNYLKIDQYFDFILGETDQRKSKSDPKLIQYLLKKYKGSKFVIIGDTPHDRELAEVLKCPFIGVLTGMHSHEDLKSNKKKVKNLILNNVSEITRQKIYSLFQI
ncbi:MAG: HAD family hydrolase [Promethearchaeota archaeon]